MSKTSFITEKVTRVRASNPSIMTGEGTNTYVFNGSNGFLILDPGVNKKEHLKAVLNAVNKEKSEKRYIAVTHTHIDHFPGYKELAQSLGAKVIGYGSKDGFISDIDFKGGETIDLGDLVIKAIYTPGHASNHLCYLSDSILYSGDHIMNGSTVIIAPPDGNMSQYIKSLRELLNLEIKAIAPGHGDIITDPIKEINKLITHRLMRESKVKDALLKLKSASISQLIPIAYSDTDPSLHKLAAYSLWAHLNKLLDEGKVTLKGDNGFNAIWSIVPG
jgi:glyoxylase-like metal-dependent hydrolase (beta-lactamase superfamily II)